MRLDIVRVTKTFRGKVRALEEVSLTVPGGILGLLGANGAGKTTLMRLLTGLIRPNNGRITIGEHDMATADGRLAVQRVLGYLPQDLGVYPDLTARQFLDYVALLKGLDDQPYRRRRVGELLELVSIADAADRKLGGYSGGMRRRVGIAQALLNDPELLIVDEPTSGLDPEERIRVRTLLSQLAERRTVLLSTHIVDDVAQTCTELAVLGRGRLIYRGTVSELTARANGNVWSLLSSGPAPSVGTVVSALPHDGATRYRVVAATRPSADAQPVIPTLEDGYVLLAQQHSLTAAESAAYPRNRHRPVPTAGSRTSLSALPIPVGPPAQRSISAVRGHEGSRSGLSPGLQVGGPAAGCGLGRAGCPGRCRQAAATRSGCRWPSSAGRPAAPSRWP